MTEDQDAAPQTASRWPWITTVLAAILAFNPIGLNIIYSAFLSGEALARNIWGPIVAIVVLILRSPSLST